MRVVFLNHYAGVFGGVESYVRRAAAGLSGLGVECILGRIEDRGEVSGYLEPFASSFKRDDVAGLVEEAARLEPDAVFVHKLADTRALLSLKGRTRLVRYVHDHDLTCPRRHKYFAWNGRICDRAAGAFCHLDAGFLEKRGKFVGFRSPRAFFDELSANRELDLLLVGSQWMQSELLANGFNPARLRVLPPSTPPSPKPAPGTGVRASTGGGADVGTDPASEPFILYVGQLIRGKGVDLLIDAFARLLGVRPRLRLVIAGSGNAEWSLKEQTKQLGIIASVRFAGQVGEEELDRLYAEAALLAVPSRWPEPFGMVGLEAMRRGLPVAAFAAGGIPDWLEDGATGILAKAGEPAALAVAMEKILADPVLGRRLGEAGRIKAERDFSFPASMESLTSYLSGEAS
ncbi:MAG: glycosyltransferase family 4 protein [Spirochaetota bacterium]